MFVSAFNSRPVLHFTEVPYGLARAMIFSDIIDRFGGDIKQSQLDQAYRRAGNSFTGQLAQNFVVMKELGKRGTCETSETTRAAEIPRGRGRGQWQGRGRGGGNINRFPDIRALDAPEGGSGA